jgi:hypothetical protein
VFQSLNREDGGSMVVRNVRWYLNHNNAQRHDAVDLDLIYIWIVMIQLKLAQQPHLSPVF